MLNRRVFLQTDTYSILCKVSKRSAKAVCYPLLLLKICGKVAAALLLHLLFLQHAAARSFWCSYSSADK